MGTGTTVLTLLSFVALGQAPAADISYINEREFKIPITLPADPAARAEIEQLQLYVSKDQGRTWQQEATATPRQDSFPFFAPGDGVYWFSVSFTDRQKRSFPPDISAVPPALKVVIDTRKPLIKLHSPDRQGDQVTFAWDIREDHVDLATLRAEYKTGDSPTWRPIPGVSPSSTSSAKFSAGSSGAVTIRMQVNDLSGNSGASQLDVPADSAGVAIGGNRPELGPGPSAAPASSGLVLPGAGASERPAAPPPAENPSWANRPAAGPGFARETTRPGDMATRGAFAAIDERRQRTPIATSHQPPPPPPKPPVATPSPAVGPGPSEPPALPSSPKRTIQYTNTNLIDLNYEVSKVGPSGVGHVTLYATMDDGSTWKEYGDDTDLTPPFSLALEAEGLYGFALIVKSKAGLGRAAPQPGQAPDIRVELDTTSPEAALYPVEADPRRKDMLFLTWDATDKNLADKPVRLYWSTKPESDWQPIALDIANTGRYAWQMPSDLPFKVYLRLQVKDLAGNVATADTQEPVLVDLTEPEGRITGLAPTGAKKPE